MHSPRAVWLQAAAAAAAAAGNGLLSAVACGCATTTPATTPAVATANPSTPKISCPRREEGVLALWRGWLPSVIGVVPYVGLNFGVYETLKDVIIKMYGEPIRFGGLDLIAGIRRQLEGCESGRERILATTAWPDLLKALFTAVSRRGNPPVADTNGLLPHCRAARRARPQHRCAAGLRRGSGHLGTGGCGVSGPEEGIDWHPLPAPALDDSPPMRPRPHRRCRPVILPQVTCCPPASSLHVRMRLHLLPQTLAYPFDVVRRRLQVSGWSGAKSLHAGALSWACGGCWVSVHCGVHAALHACGSCQASCAAAERGTHGETPR